MREGDGRAITVRWRLLSGHQTPLAGRSFGCIVTQANLQETPVPREIYPSSYLCDCGHQSDFSENTISEVKAMSHKRKVYLGDAMPDEHTIVFYKGKMVDIICPLRKEREPAPD